MCDLWALVAICLWLLPVIVQLQLGADPSPGQLATILSWPVIIAFAAVVLAAQQAAWLINQAARRR